MYVVSFAAVIRVVTQRVGEKRCVTTLITAAKETTRSVNRKKNNVTQGKKLWMHMSKEKDRAPQKFNGPLLSNVT